MIYDDIKENGIHDENVYFKFHEIIKNLLLLPENIACNPRNVDLGK